LLETFDIMILALKREVVAAEVPSELVASAVAVVSSDPSVGVSSEVGSALVSSDASVGVSSEVGSALVSSDPSSLESSVPSSLESSYPSAAC
jgi:hypothetical protein